MDLYVLGSTYLKTTPVDVFNSLIWTERYNAAGDVTLTIPDTSPFKDVLVEGAFLHTPQSIEVMLIETVERKDGVITITGTSLVGFLKNRLFRNSWSTNASSWALTGTAGHLANYVMLHMCEAGGLMAGGTILATGASEVIAGLTNAAEVSGTSLTIDVPYGNLYDGLKTICDLDDLGFTLYPPSITDGTGATLFKAYRGLDRTSSQSVNAAVIFDPAMDTLADVSELRSIAGYVTVAYAWASGMTAQSSLGVAYAPGTSAFTGFNRRSLMVEAYDINSSDYTAANLKLALDQRARDALANNNYVRMTDGQIVPQNTYVYGTDYNLGDIIELRGTSNIAQKARITEYIRAQDSTGERAYPTLSVIS